MAKILLAVAPTAMPMMIHGFPPKHDLVPCLTLEEAEVVLCKEDIDLVVCGVYFDENRMFDLLRFAQSDPSVNAIPILCVKALPDMLGSTFLQAVDIAARALGARKFVDFSEWLLQVGENEAFERLHEVIQRLLPST